MEEKQEIANKILEFILEHTETKEDLKFLESIIDYYEKERYDINNFKKRYMKQVENVFMLFEDYNTLEKLNHIASF